MKHIKRFAARTSENSFDTFHKITSENLFKLVFLELLEDKSRFLEGF